MPNPMRKGSSVRCLPVMPGAACTASTPKNSFAIQYELAVIQKTIAKLWANSDL